MPPSSATCCETNLALYPCVRTKTVEIRPVHFGGFCLDRQHRSLFARNPPIEPLQPTQGENRNGRCGDTKRPEACSKAQTDDRDHPQGCGCGHPDDQPASLQNRAAADEPDTREDAQRKAEHVSGAEELAALPLSESRRLASTIATHAASPTRMVVRNPAACPRDSLSSPIKAPATTVMSRRRAMSCHVG